MFIAANLRRYILKIQTISDVEIEHFNKSMHKENITNRKHTKLKVYIKKKTLNIKAINAENMYPKDGHGTSISRKIYNKTRFMIGLHCVLLYIFLHIFVLCLSLGYMLRIRMANEI